MGARFAFLLALVVLVGCEAWIGSVGGIFKRGRTNLFMGSTDVTMPALSSTMTEGKIVSWSKSVGDKVEAGEVLLVVESDKADMDVESYEDGYLGAIITPEGESANVGAPVAVIVDTPEEVGNAAAGGGGAPAAAAAPADATPAAAAPAAGGGGGVSDDTIQVMMPALSSTMTEGKIVSWAKNVGDKVEAGEVLLVVESDKADMDVESYEDGFLAAILTQEGDAAPVGQPVALIAPSADKIDAVAAQAGAALAGGGAAPAAPAAEAPAATPAAAAPATTSSAGADGHVPASGFARAEASAKGVDISTVTASRPDGFITSKDLASGSAAAAGAYTPAAGVIHATPTARMEAKKNNIDIASVTGTGVLGRVTKEDVLRKAGKWVEPVKSAPAAPAPAAASGGAPAAKKDAAVAVQDGVVEMDGMQKAVAKNMEATLAVPIFRVSREIRTDDFDALYAELKPKGVTVSAMLAKACAMAMEKYPVINAAYVPGGIKYHADVNVAMAVAIDGGLITPTIVGADKMDLFSVGRKWKELVGKAKEKKLSPAEYSSGTFTISNLGMFGVQQFDAILPPGTGSILAIAASTPKVVQQKNGHFGVQKSMTVTITCDHRHIYGADAAGFLAELADVIENRPKDMLMG